MTEIKVITDMCKAGKVQEAYKLAQDNCTAETNSPWAQRALGWALYYIIKADAEVGDFTKLTEHLDELKDLDLLSVDNDSMIYSNVEFQIAAFTKKHIYPTDTEANSKLSAFYHRLKDYQCRPSRGHSFLLQTYIKFESWDEMIDFIDWWDLDNLLPEDYTPFETQGGQKLMTLAERAFIAKSKALLNQNDNGRIEEFLPKLDSLMTNHPQMLYTGYYYGKLLLKLGDNADEALNAIIPFARKKSTEFWVWQLLSDIFTHNKEKQLACLLRAVHCKAKETFLGKVRIKLATIYIQANQLDKAKFHIDAITRCYVSQGWKLPYEVTNWIHQPWIDTTLPNGNASIDYMGITNQILCEGAEEAIAIVTYIDLSTHRTTLIYGSEKKMSYKLRIKTSVGSILRINYIKETDGKPKILNALKATLPNALTYIKETEGTISKRENNEYAFLNSPVGPCFLSPVVIQKYNIKNKERVKALIAYDHNKKKNSWNWTCITVKK